MSKAKIIVGDCRAVLASMDAESVDCCVTSPPYWGLRDYGITEQIGLEKSVDAWVAELVAVFEGVRRALKPTGTLWLNLGDAYAGSWGAQGRGDKRAEMEQGGRIEGSMSRSQIAAAPRRRQTGSLERTGQCKAKDLIGQPWLVAFALRAAGWYLRADIIWHKPNPMPESITDRPTKAHEYIFLMSKSERYGYDAASIAEKCEGQNAHDVTGPGYDAPGQTPQRGSRKMPAVAGWASGPGSHDTVDHTRGCRNRMPPIGGVKAVGENGNGNRTYSGNTPEFKETRNARSVWTIPTQGYKGSHFATFPRELAARCIKAGCPAGGLVLDPFAGTGTTIAEAVLLGRKGVGIELNPEYAKMAEKRIDEQCGLLAMGGEAA